MPDEAISFNEFEGGIASSPAAPRNDRSREPPFLVIARSARALRARARRGNPAIQRASCQEIASSLIPISSIRS